MPHCTLSTIKKKEKEKKMLRQITNWGKIFAVHVSEKGSISFGIIRELINISMNQ
jgi:predicted HTH domain antitoxin